MEKTLYVINEGGFLTFDIGERSMVLDGVKPFDVDGLKYIRHSINHMEVEKNIKIIESQLTFTDVRNDYKR